MLLGGEWEGLGFEGEFFDIVETEEEIVEWRCSIVGNFYGLGVLAVELNDFRVDCDEIRLHSVKFKKIYCKFKNLLLNLLLNFLALLSFHLLNFLDYLI